MCTCKSQSRVDLMFLSIHFIVTSIYQQVKIKCTLKFHTTEYKVDVSEFLPCSGFRLHSATSKNNIQYRWCISVIHSHAPTWLLNVPPRLYLPDVIITISSSLITMSTANQRRVYFYVQPIIDNIVKEFGAC